MTTSVGGYDSTGGVYPGLVRQMKSVSPQDTFAASGASPLPPFSPSAGDTKAAPLVFGSVSLDIHFSRSETFRSYAASETPDGYSQVYQELTRQMEAGLSLDFSFMGAFEGAAGRLAGLDQSVFAEWAGAASDLLSFDEKDMEEFVAATDELFNEIEKLLGMGPEGLDFASDFFADRVRNFIGMVKDKMEQFDANTSKAAAPGGGLGIRNIIESMKESLPEEFKRYLEDKLGQLSENLPDGALFRSLDDLRKVFEEYLARLMKKDGAEPEAPENKTAAESAGFSYSYVHERREISRALFVYAGEDAAGADKNNPLLPPTLLA